MINLGQYINNLLKLHPEVSVPGMGLFRKDRIPASFDQEKDSFVPPKRIVILFADAGSDLLIRHAIREQEQVSDNKARELLDLAVNALLARLENQGSVTLDGVGYLQYQEGTLSLTGTDTAYPGLKATEDRLPADDQEKVPETAEETKEETVVTDAVIEEEVVEPISTEAEEIHAEVLEDKPEDELEATTYPDNNEEAAAGKPGLWIWLVSGIILIGLAAAAWWYYHRSIPADAPAGIDSAIAAGAADSIRQQQIADSLAAQAAQPDTLANDSATVDSAHMKTDPKALAGTISYEIIIASFPTMEKAEQYVARMNKKGYHMRAIKSKMPGNRKKVSYGSYLSEVEAYHALTKVQQELTKDAWIFRLKQE